SARIDRSRERGGRHLVQRIVDGTRSPGKARRVCCRRSSTEDVDRRIVALRLLLALSFVFFPAVCFACRDPLTRVIIGITFALLVLPVILASARMPGTSHE